VGGEAAQGRPGETRDAAHLLFGDVVLGSLLRNLLFHKRRAHVRRAELGARDGTCMSDCNAKGPAPSRALLSVSPSSWSWRTVLMVKSKSPVSSAITLLKPTSPCFAATYADCRVQGRCVGERGDMRGQRHERTATGQWRVSLAVALSSRPSRLSCTLLPHLEARGDEGVDRANVDDAAVAPLAHGGQEGARGHCRPDEHDVHQLLPLFRREGLR